VNHTPSFNSDTPLDALIKRNLISDALKLMNVSVKNRNDIMNERKEMMQQRVLTGKKTKMTPEEKQ
jgi:tubulin polyglutamylase TTLL6/13